VKGITTNIRYLKAVMDHPEFAGGDYDTSFLVRGHQELLGTEDAKLREVALMAAVVYAQQRDQAKRKQLTQKAGAAQGGASAWRSGLRRGRR
jgi:acetyl-CoA carboxylase biotin carboxylase subunit